MVDAHQNTKLVFGLRWFAGQLDASSIGVSDGMALDC